MFDWLFEGRLSVYVLLAASAILCVVVWLRTRKRRWLAGAGAAVALAGLYCLLDFSVETDREQIQRKVQVMAAGLKTPPRLDAVFDNVSDSFHCDFADSKKALRDKAQQAIGQWNITEVRISGFDCPEIARDRNTATAVFKAKIVGSFGGPEAVTVSCKATFDYEAAHGWRMRGLEVRGEPPLPEGPLVP